MRIWANMDESFESPGVLLKPASVLFFLRGKTNEP